MKQARNSDKPDTGVKLLTNYRNLNPSRGLDSTIEESMRQIGGMIAVESAAVTVEKSVAESPPIAVYINIKTPGPDIAVAARDYTSSAAFNKAWRQLNKHANRASKQFGIRRKKLHRKQPTH